MALFKKTPVSKKSTGSGLFKKAEPAKLRARHGSEEVPAAGFPTSEDIRMGQTSATDQPGADPDTRFLQGERVSLQSSNVAWCEYDESTQSLKVGFNNGAAYAYAGVPSHVALGLLHADSPGSYVGTTLRGRYHADKVT